MHVKINIRAGAWRRIWLNTQMTVTDIFETERGILCRPFRNWSDIDGGILRNNNRRGIPTDEPKATSENHNENERERYGDLRLPSHGIRPPNKTLDCTVSQRESVPGHYRTGRRDLQKNYRTNRNAKQSSHSRSVAPPLNGNTSIYASSGPCMTTIHPLTVRCRRAS